jgi:hypothetical protein
MVTVSEASVALSTSASVASASAIKTAASPSVRLAEYPVPGAALSFASRSRVGESFTAVIVSVTVAVAIPPLPSLTL